MPANPFGTNDPLHGRSGAWGGTGQGGGGFGASSAQGTRAESYAVEPDGEEYDVVDIAADPASSAGASFAKNGKGGGGGKQPQSVAAREAALAKREAEVARREEAVRRSGAGYNVAAEQVRNFPRCWPIVHHDITNDIPDGKRGITRAGFLVFLLTVVALLYNMVAVIISVIIADFGGVAAAIILSILYVIIGVPGAWVMWYKRLYLGMAKDGAVSFAAFFSSFMIHIAFCIWSAIAPTIGDLKAGAAHTGFLPAVDFFGEKGAGNKTAGVLFIAGAAYWSALAFLSFLYLGRVYRYFRGSPAERDAQRQVQAGAVNAGVQMSQAQAQGARR